MPTNRRSPVWQWVSIVLLCVAIIAALLFVAGPRIVVGDPLPRMATYRYLPKPTPPKAVGALDAAVKPPVVDLGTDPASVSIAAPDLPLRQSVEARVQQAFALAGDVGRSSVYVMDADGQVLFDSEGTVPLIPASTSKMVTAAVVLATFGPDHRFTTTVSATTPPDAGVVAGNLLLVGGGDPTLVSPEYVELRTNPTRPSTPITALADQVVAAGIIRVDGGVVGDPGYLDGPTLADGWPPRYLEDLDATPIQGLTIDQGFEFFDEGGQPRARAAADPAVQAARALTEALTQRGVVVAAEPTSLLEEERSDGAVGLAALASPTVRELLTRVVQNSDNHMADTLFRAAGRHAEGIGAFADASDLTADLLAALELDWSSTTLADGSGLSRASLIPAALLTTLNYRMTNSTVGMDWQDLMAVSGVSGTLERRLVGTIAELRLRGKTGSLADVRALSGAVVGPDGRPLYFTAISNDLAGQQLGAARRLQDLLVLGLTAELYGCTEIPPDQVIPGQVIPGQVIPGQDIPGQDVPGQAPADGSSEAPDEPTPADQTPDPPAPGELPPLPQYSC